MIESIIMLLIYVCVLALVLYLVVYVLGVIGIPIPPKVIQIVWVIFALLVILWVARIFLAGGSISLPGAVGLSMLGPV